MKKEKQNKKNENLKSCPCCKSNKIILYSGEYPDPKKGNSGGFDFKPKCYVECRCGLQTKMYRGWQSKGNAIKAWNRRSK